MFKLVFVKMFLLTNLNISFFNHKMVNEGVIITEKKKMKMNMTYGIGYQGSKNRIAKDIIGVLPSGERFVDLFAGGCSITHCAMVSGKYNRFLANDIDGRIPQTFKNAIEGKFANERRWIARDDFFKLKESDMYARLCFSFGNNQKTYMYNTNIEPYKKACHYAIVFDEWD